MLSDDQDSSSITGFDWSFDIWGDIPDYEGDSNDNIVLFSYPDAVNIPKFFCSPFSQSTGTSETNSEPDPDEYPDEKIFKDNEDLSATFLTIFNSLLNLKILSTF